jgi:hypothetical protein
MIGAPGFLQPVLKMRSSEDYPGEPNVVNGVDVSFIATNGTVLASSDTSHVESGNRNAINLPVRRSGGGLLALLGTQVPTLKFDRSGRRLAAV